jgi:pimeloyl-ACP methyl ester carboxylesterase
MEAPSSHIYFSQRLRLHYVAWGDPDAPPLLLIHGGRDHCRCWDWVAEDLRGDYRVLAPDLRGHGDSQWAPGGSYYLVDFVYDVVQLVRQTQLTGLTIIAHSLGGSIALLYAGLFPDTVRKLVVIEGLGPPPKMVKERINIPVSGRMQNWIDDLQKLASRAPRRYPSLQAAFERMREENPHLTEAQAKHLTFHGSHQNEDGTYSWKFDNYIRVIAPINVSESEQIGLWRSIACPTLLVNGTGSWAPDPEADGSARHFQDARVASIPGAVIGRIMIVLTCPCRKCARSWVRECSFVDLPAK